MRQRINWLPPTLLSLSVVLLFAATVMNDSEKGFLWVISTGAGSALLFTAWALVDRRNK